MGKKKDGKKKDGARKPGKIRLPKEIGGVKLPKELRKSTEALIEAARDAAGRELFAAGLTAVIANATKKPSPAPAPQPPVEAMIVEEKEPRPAARPDELAGALGAVATLALQRLLAAGRKE